MVEDLAAEVALAVSTSPAAVALPALGPSPAAGPSLPASPSPAAADYRQMWNISVSRKLILMNGSRNEIVISHTSYAARNQNPHTCLDLVVLLFG